MLNRAALIIRYKQPFVDWINEKDLVPENTLTLDEVNEEHRVYLIEVEDEKELRTWLKLNYAVLFEEELEWWYVDESLWPEDRSLELFKKWAHFELHTIVFDRGHSPIEDDEI